MARVRPAWPPAAVRGPTAVPPRTLLDTAVAVRHGVQVPDTRGRPAAAGAHRAGGPVATGTGRRVGDRWWDAASAGGREQAAWSAGRGAGRGRRSSPAA
jgi:hypothetical protein